jgi:hypothetical protein
VGERKGHLQGDQRYGQGSKGRKNASCNGIYREGSNPANLGGQVDHVSGLVALENGRHVVEAPEVSVLIYTRRGGRRER